LHGKDKQHKFTFLYKTGDVPYLKVAAIAKGKIISPPSFQLAFEASKKLFI
jgi:hypothetical protein